MRWQDTKRFTERNYQKENKTRAVKEQASHSVRSSEGVQEMSWMMAKRSKQTVTREN
jgi:hypothetical protein